MPKNSIDNDNSSSVADLARGVIKPSGPTDADDTLTVGSEATGDGARLTPADPPVSDAPAMPNVSAGNGHAGEDDRFDPARLRIDHTSSAALGAQRVILNVPVRKPPPQTFIRVHPSSDMRLDVLVIELKNERETYLVTPQMALALAAEAKPVRMLAPRRRRHLPVAGPHA